MSNQPNQPGFDALLQDAAADNAARIFDRKTAHLPASCVEALAFRRLRILNVIDDFSRECLAAVVDTFLSGDRVARELDRIAEMRG